MRLIEKSEQHKAHMLLCPNIDGGNACHILSTWIILPRTELEFQAFFDEYLPPLRSL
jgi:hypothetical protein